MAAVPKSLDRKPGITMRESCYQTVPICITGHVATNGTSQGEDQMTFWRMQLHPGESEGAIKHTVESLSAGYIGLDFATDVPDLLTITKDSLPSNQRNYWAFAHEMAVDDRVLLFAHHYPFALVRIAGPYNFIRAAAPELGVWFRHFRPIDDVRYYGDFNTNARSWESLTMTATITPLRDTTSESYKLIDHWLKRIGTP